MKKKHVNTKAKRNHKTFLVEMLPKHTVGAEIGVWTGKFTKQVLDIVRPEQFHLIDPYIFMPQYPDRWYGGSRAKSQAAMDKIFDDIKHRFGPLSCIHIHRAKAADAASRFTEAFFDWVYIDGDHSYKEVKRDINRYLPLVKPGGFLCGDDWQLSSVQRAVNELLRPEHEVHSRTYQWWTKKPKVK